MARILHGCASYVTGQNQNSEHPADKCPEGNSVVSVAVRVSLKRRIWRRMPDTVVSVDAWLTFVTVNSITALHFSSVVVMRRRTSGPSVLNAIARSQRVKRRVVCLIRRCLSFLMARSGPTESLACDQTGDHPAKKRSPRTPRPSHAEKNSRFRAVNMLTGCPGILRFYLYYSVCCAEKC